MCVYVCAICTPCAHVCCYNPSQVAAQVLEDLLAEDEHVAAVWYLLGWSQYLLQNFATAEESLQTAAALYDKDGSDRPEMREHVSDLLSALAKPNSSADDEAAAVEQD